MWWRVPVMLGLIVGKTLAGEAEIKPMDTVFTVVELAAVFGAGWHLAHSKGKESAIWTRIKSYSLWR